MPTYTHHNGKVFEFERMPNDWDRLQILNGFRQQEWDENGDCDLAFCALEFMTESGELCEQVKKLVREINGMKGNRTSLDKIKEEVGDVVISFQKLLAGISEHYDVILDPMECAAKKFDQTSEKYGFKTRWDSIRE